MPSRLSNLLPLRARSRRLVRAADRCDACGRSIVAADHAIQLDGGNFHAGCVLYRRRGGDGAGGGSFAGPGGSVAGRGGLTAARGGSKSAHGGSADGSGRRTSSARGGAPTAEMRPRTKHSGSRRVKTTR